MLFLISISLLCISILLITSLFKLKRLSETVVIWALLAYSEIVFVFQIANLFSQLNATGFILILQTGILLISIFLWFSLKKPALVPKIKKIPSPIEILREKKNWPNVVLFLSLLAVLLLYFVLIYVVPPNNNDALSIHIARIIKWKQQGSYFPWETPFTWQVTFPVNAQLTYLWTVLFTNSDHFIAYIPCLSGLVTGILIYLLTMELGFTRRLSCFSALIWLAFPVVQLHLTSVRHDLISTWLFINIIYFLFLWKKRNQKKYMGFSALALGLVIGTNLSIAAYLPGIIIVAILLLVFHSISFKELVYWGSSAGLLFLVFSSPIYISNWFHFQSPVGPDAAAMTSVAITAETTIWNYLWINITRWCYQLFDFSWLPHALEVIVVNGKAWVMQQLFGVFRLQLEGNIATMNAHEFYWNTAYQLQEDEAWYGLIGALLIFPTSLIAFIQGIKKKNIYFLTPFIFFITALVTCSLIRPGWTPYDGRYFMPLSALCATLLPMWLKGEKSRTYIQYALVGLSLFTIMMVVAYNPSKQVVGGAAIWNMNRIDRLTRQSYTSKEMLYLVEGAIPEDAVVGIATNHIDYQEYGIFGENFTRRIVNVYPPEKIADKTWLNQRGVTYLLILVSEGYPSGIANGYQYVESLGDWVVYTNQTLP